MHVNLGGYHVSDIEFTAAFDVTAGEGRQGSRRRDLGPSERHDQVRRRAEDRHHRQPRHDPRRDRQVPLPGRDEGAGETDDIVGILQETKTDVVVSYLPVGSEAAAKWYAEQWLEAGVALVNCMPVFIARENYWQKRFEEKGLPIIGDDIKSQVGATITHRVLTSLFRERVKLDKTMQLNVGNSTFSTCSSATASSRRRSRRRTPSPRCSTTTWAS